VRNPQEAMDNMATKKKYDTKKAAEDLGKFIKSFGDAVSEIFDDPELRKKAKEFSQSVLDSAAKVIDNRIKDTQIKARVRDVGKAAQTFGRTITENLKTEE